jgi:hypothetical protein
VLTLFMALLSFVESTPRAYRLKASNAAPSFSTSPGTIPIAFLNAELQRAAKQPKLANNLPQAWWRLLARHRAGPFFTRRAPPNRAQSSALALRPLKACSGRCDALTDRALNVTLAKAEKYQTTDSINTRVKYVL